MASYLKALGFLTSVVGSFFVCGCKSNNVRDNIELLLEEIENKFGLRKGWAQDQMEWVWESRRRKPGEDKTDQISEPRQKLFFSRRFVSRVVAAGAPLGLSQLSTGEERPRCFLVWSGEGVVPFYLRG